MINQMILRRCSVRGSVLLPDPDVDLVGLMLLTGPQRHQNMRLTCVEML